MKTMTGVAAALLVFGVVATAGMAVADDAESRVRSISVAGQGEAAGSPDRATINAGVQIRAASVIEASRENQAVVARIMQALAKEDVRKKDIQTVDYSIWPEQRHDPRGSGETVITGYRVNNTVRVTVTDIDRLGKILAAVTGAGANTIHGIAFSVSDTSDLERRARAEAMGQARARAEALARLAGVRIGKVLNIAQSSGGVHPMPVMGGRMEMAQAAPVPDIAAGQHSVSVQVQVSYEILD